MKYTLNDCLARINQVLNYPAVGYEDVYHFFDQAIAELNTNLRIALPSVSEMRSEHTFDITEQENIVRLTERPDNVTIIPYYDTDLPANGPESGKGEGAYVCNGSFSDRAFYRWDGAKWNRVDKLYGIFFNDDDWSLRTYIAVPITTTVAVWTPVDRTHIEEFDLTDYLPVDWWTLFVIPYVCFKFSVRNGDSGELFADEFTQGYQQLQSSYHVPNVVVLTTVAGKPAYTEIVKQNINNLNIPVFTRAIYESMRVGNGIPSIYGGFYEAGDWRI